MKFRILAIIAAAFLAISALSTSADAGERYGKQKVVYHINYPGGEADKAYKGAMRNVQNHINAVGADNLDLKVVVHGGGIGMMLSAKKTGGLR
jgi:uncharacterized protein